MRCYSIPRRARKRRCCAGATLPTDYNGFIQGIGAGSQIRLNATDADGGLYLMGAATAQAYIAAGSYFTGSVHVAKSATTSGLTLFDGNGIFVANTGLTPGALYNPTEIGRWDTRGIKMAQGKSVRLVGDTLTNLSPSPDGSLQLFNCTDCNAGTNPCTSGGTGALAVRVNAVWICP